jgi:hypothetical protein
MARRPIHLKVLAETHSAEIDRMTDAMRRDDSGALWTAEMRAITRGGKCLMAAAGDEPESI